MRDTGPQAAKDVSGHPIRVWRTNAFSGEQKRSPPGPAGQASEHRVHRGTHPAVRMRSQHILQPGSEHEPAGQKSAESAAERIPRHALHSRHTLQPGSKHEPAEQIDRRVSRGTHPATRTALVTHITAKLRARAGCASDCRVSRGTHPAARTALDTNNI